MIWDPSPLGIVLLGCGVVGSGVARALLEDGDDLERKCGRRLLLNNIVVAHPEKPRPHVPRSLLTTDARAAVRDERSQLVIELLGGTTLARELILAALHAGKDVVTANKAVLAEHGEELFAAARQADRTLCFEGSVGGGIPILRTIQQGLAANRLYSLKAILNGTSNFVLTQMAEHGQDYAVALAEAQRLGFAEADPTLDVDGTDAAQKLAILAWLAFGVRVATSDIERRGIADLAAADMRFASGMGCVIKLIAEAWLEDDQLALHVEPTLVRRHQPLAEVRGAFNAMEVEGDRVGPIFISGRGAGSQPTTSAVLSDVLDVARGSARTAFAALCPPFPSPPLRRRPAELIHSRFYLRLSTQGSLGVLAAVDGVLARHGIRIASLATHESSQPGGAVPVVVMTNSANLRAVRQAVEELAAVPAVVEPPVYYPLAE